MESNNKSPIGKRKIYPNLDEVRDCFDEGREATLSPQKHDTRDDRSLEREKTPYHSDESISQDEKSSLPFSWITLFVVVIIALIVGVFLRRLSKNHDTLKPSINCSSFTSLNDKYENQDKKLFKALQAGIEGMYKKKPQVPTVVTFFSTNEETINEVLRDVIKIAKECINQSHEPLSLSHKDFNIEKFFKDNRKIITEYKNKLEESTIMVINNVDKIKSEIVGSLHSFADTVNPLVSKTILYLTVIVPEKPVGNKVNYIYTYLQNQWKDLAENIRDPLITRLIDQTFYIN